MSKMASSKKGLLFLIVAKPATSNVFFDVKLAYFKNVVFCFLAMPIRFFDSFR